MKNPMSRTLMCRECKRNRQMIAIAIGRDMIGMPWATYRCPEGHDKGFLPSGVDYRKMEAKLKPYNPRR